MTKKLGTAQPQAGFTIVELLIVIVVIAILSAVSFVAYQNIQERAREASISVELKNTERAISLYKAEHDRLPADLAAASIKNSAHVRFEYSPTDEGSYCITGSTQKTSMKIDHVGMLSKGSCPGHSVNGVAAVTNFVPNPSFELNHTGWAWVNGAGYTGSRSTAQKHSGNSSFAITAPSTGVADRYLETYVSAGAAGTYTVSAYVYLTGDGPTQQDRDTFIHIGTGSGSNAGEEQKYDRGRLNQWQRLTRTVTFNTPASSARIRFYAPLGGTIYVDSIMMTQGTAVTPYGDGSTPNWTWSGAPHNSPSRGAPL